MLLLVSGTCTSDLEMIADHSQSLTAGGQTFLVKSNGVRCLLSETNTQVDLRGYCDFQSMLQYRLDTDDALVLISALVPGNPRPVLTVERMQKVNQAEKDVLIQSLKEEWTTALQDHSKQVDESHVSPAKSEYWDQAPRKARRIVSEAQSPMK